MTEMSGIEWDSYDPVPDMNLEAYNRISREIGEKVLSPDTYNKPWLDKISEEFGGEK